MRERLPLMNRFSITKEIGDGAFGKVFHGIRKKTGQEVAIKHMKQSFKSWEEGAKLREFRAIWALSHQSKHLVEIFEIIREKDASLYFVCEFMPDGTLNDLLTKTRKERTDSGVEPAMIMSISWQVLQGLDHIHSKGYIHRDLKPENILLRGSECKIADFSLARTAVSSKKMTSYVATRWYRPPEIILCDPQYSKPVDLFSLGCVMAEMFQLKPLFPGTKEIDQLRRYFELLGPLETEWPNGMHLFNALGFDDCSFVRADLGDEPDPPLTRLRQHVSNADYIALRFLVSLLRLDPKRRSTTRGALQHEYFLPAGPPLIEESDTKLSPQPRSEDILPTPTKTPTKTSFHDYLSKSSRAPYVSISPSERNKLTTASGCPLQSKESIMNPSAPPNCFALQASHPDEMRQSHFSGLNEPPQVDGCRPCDAFLVDW